MPVSIKSSTTGDDKKWQFVAADDGNYYLVNKQFNRRLDGNNSNNVDISETADATNNDQRWILEASY